MKSQVKSLKLTNDQIQTLWIILSEVQKTVETGDVQPDGDVYTSYENYLLVLDKNQVTDLNEIIKQL
ncbi:MAG: hypothetical protein LBV47_05140 [Bacteroidales bacterium]|jgi:hypothetical protein|nr:hypothetical protein [Bacteroidales bacterium]